MLIQHQDSGWVRHLTYAKRIAPDKVFYMTSPGLCFFFLTCPHWEDELLSSWWNLRTRSPGKTISTCRLMLCFYLIKLTFSVHAWRRYITLSQESKPVGKAWRPFFATSYRCEPIPYILFWLQSRRDARDQAPFLQWCHNPHDMPKQQNKCLIFCPPTFPVFFQAKAKPKAKKGSKEAKVSVVASKAPLTKAPPHEAPAVNFPVARPPVAKAPVAKAPMVSVVPPVQLLFTPEARMPEGKGVANGIEMKQLGGPSNPGWAAGEWISGQQGSVSGDLFFWRCSFLFVESSFS